MNFSLLLASSDPVGHMVNKPFITTEGGIWLWSSHMGNLVLTGIIMIVGFKWVASKISTGPSSDAKDAYVTTNPIAHMIEVVSLYLRDNTVRAVLGDRTDKFMPFLWTLFYFILINNLLGLVPIIDLLYIAIPSLANSHTAPIGATATQNIWVTGAMAAIAAVVINVAGIRRLGVGPFVKHLTAGAPWAVWPIMVPIEAAGILIKPAALCIRLFANMTAGHILVATLLGFAAAGMKMGIGGIAGITTVSAVATVAIYFLELFVAFIQAFVFMFLTAVFIAMLDHHHDEAHEHAAHHEGHARAAPA